MNARPAYRAARLYRVVCHAEDVVRDLTGIAGDLECERDESMRQLGAEAYVAVNAAQALLAKLRTAERLADAEVEAQEAEDNAAWEREKARQAEVATTGSAQEPGQVSPRTEPVVAQSAGNPPGNPAVERSLCAIDCARGGASVESAGNSASRPPTAARTNAVGATNDGRKP